MVTSPLFRPVQEFIQSRIALPPGLRSALSLRTLVLTALTLGLPGSLTACSRERNVQPAGAGGNGQEAAPALRREVELSAWTWRASGLSGSMQAGFTISNASNYSVKDIMIVCTQKSVSGGVLSTAEKTVSETWEPGEIRAVSRFAIGLRNDQTASSEGSILSWTAVTPEGETKMK
jgi:hypothetical protein